MAGYEIADAVNRIIEHVESVMSGLKAEKIIFFLDEPGLGQAGFSFKEWWEFIFADFSVTRGVHICGDMDWDQLFEAEIDIVSFDASKSERDITKYPKYKDFRNKGGRVAWGVLEKEDVKDFREGDLITLPCGMGTKLYTVDDCPRVLKKLNKIAKEVAVLVQP